MNSEYLTLTRIIVLAACMIYASYKDWMEREVDDLVWIIGGCVAGILTVIDLAFYSWNTHILLATILSIILSSGLAFTFYFLGLYGGADAKAIAMISIGLPLYYPPIRLHPFTGLATLSNGLIISLSLLLIFLLWNLIALARGEKIFEGFEHESKLRKLAAMLFGIRIKNARSRKFWFPLETEKNGRRTFNFKLLSIELEEPTRDDCWATPGIPLLIFITLGFLSYILVGDLIRLIYEFIVRIAPFT